MKKRRIAILGAGPVGLEAALAASEAGLPFKVYEVSGAVADNVRSWGHVQLFTPWSMNVSSRARRALSAVNAGPPANEGRPTGEELVELLLEPIGSLPAIKPYIEFHTRVIEVGRDGLLKSDEIGTPARADSPFRLLLRGEGGKERVEYAEVVLDCTGSYDHPNALGVGGVAAPGEHGVAEYIIRRIPDVEAPLFTGDGVGWAGQRILLVGAGHSAQTTAKDLAALVERVPDTSVVWAIRGAAPTFGAVADDTLPARDALVQQARHLALEADSPFDVRLGRSVDALEASGDGIVVTLRQENGESEEVVVDRIISLTGSVGDARMYRQLQVHECWATSGPMRLAAVLLASTSADCLTGEGHGIDSLKSPEPDFFILGSKSYGRNATFLMRVGWEQINEVFSLLGAVPVAAEDSP